ncbi:hypothetical protein PCAR4_840143 [Paraburkholderia caribensis]|nr:hypothetical protein PCAR4_840143 [Paraburkholderia caribensis]
MIWLDVVVDTVVSCLLKRFRSIEYSVFSTKWEIGSFLCGEEQAIGIHPMGGPASASRLRVFTARREDAGRNRRYQ